MRVGPEETRYSAFDLLSRAGGGVVSFVGE